MKIMSLVVGPIMTNCYILCDENKRVCAIVDPGDEPERILSAVKKADCVPQAIFLTHGHFDHYSGVPGVLAAYPDLPVYIHRKDSAEGRGGELKFRRLEDKNQRYYAEGDTLSVGDIPLIVMETPGHSAGSVCLITDGVIFCGDTLFYANCGRTDLADGSGPEMLQSLARLGQLEGDYQCLPGHDRITRLSFERQYNPYMKQGLAQ